MTAERNQVTTGLVKLRGKVGQFGILWAFILLTIFLTAQSSAFLTTSNLLNLLNNAAPQLIIGAAATLVIIAGGFDLSVGAVFALAAVVAAKLAPVLGPVGALLVGVLVGLVAGLVNGTVIAYGRVNSFMATLASSMVVGGIAFVITKGTVVVVESQSYGQLGQARFLTVPIPVYVAVAFVIVMGILLARTVVGRHIYATGDNAEAASLAGVNVRRIVLLTFALSGLAAGLAGVVYSSRFQSGQADAGGIALTLAVIAAIVVGGTSIRGGEGAVWRTFVGVLFIAVIGNGFNLLQIEATYQQIVQGLIILTAVALDGWSRLRRS